MRSQLAFRLVLTFFVFILAGALALYFFGFETEPSKGRFLASLFTSTSAVCVTGLTVVDLHRETGFTGQLIVLLLIQAGGLGVLTLGNWILLSLRGGVGFSGAFLTRETLGGLPRLTPAGVLHRIFLFTFATEAAGALLLFLRFMKGHDLGQAVWCAVFTSVSAFCNAGFSVFGDSLASYRLDPVVNGTVMFLIVAGGIGFVAAVDLFDWASILLSGRGGRRRRLSFHTRMVVYVSIILLAGGFVLFLLLEWRNTLAGEGLAGKVLESLFLSVTARTAGFNTVTTGHLTNMTLVVLMLLMVVGASPGSTGGGVKTTALGILWGLVRSRFQNRSRTEIMGCSIPYEVVAKALAVMILYGTMVVLAMLVLQGTEFGGLPHDRTRGLFLEQLFEVISALSTVGLSTGVTGQLSSAGLSVLMACMFVGRLGPLVVVASLIGERPRLPYTCPEADVMVG